MDSNEVSPLIKRNLIPITLGIVGLLLVLVSLYQVFFVNNKSDESPIVFQESEKEIEVTEIIVDVEGAVLSPGVYTLTSDQRIVDALAKAGGLSEDADRQWVEKNINLAGKLTDGLKIYIPRTGEDILSESESLDTGAGSAGPVININLASSADLVTLPGVGEVTAKKIIDGRPYASVDELLSKKVVGAGTFEKIKEKIAAN